MTHPSASKNAFIPTWMSVLSDVLFQKLRCKHLPKTSLEMVTFPHGKEEKSSSKKTFKKQTIIVTGPTSGIGETTALTLALRGHRVILACRTVFKGETMVKKWQQKYSSKNTRLKLDCVVMKLDLNSLRSIREFAKTFTDVEDRLDVLINNAGVFDMSNKYVLTEDAYEQHHGTNFLAPSLLSLLLIGKMLETKTTEGCETAARQSNSRIVFVSSKLHEFAKNYDMQKKSFGFSAKKAYANSKMAEIAFAKVLERKVCKAFYTNAKDGRDPSNAPIKMMSLHPGNIITNVVKTLPKLIQFLYRTTMRQILFTCDEGARATVYCAQSEYAFEEAKGKFGSYFDSACELREPNSLSEIEEEGLWREVLKEFGMSEAQLIKEWQTALA